MEQLEAEEFVEGGLYSLREVGGAVETGFPPACPALPGNKTQKGLGTKLEMGRFQLQTESEVLGLDPA